MKSHSSHRLAVLAAAFAFGAAVAAPAWAGAVVKSGVGFEAAGKVVARSPDRIVVRTDDHGHPIAFAIDRSTVVPDEIAVGTHVRVVYHPMGSTGQTADEVQRTTSRAASR